MSSLLKVLTTWIFGLVVLSGSASALTTSTASLTCSPTVKLQAKIDSVPAGTVATINVSGVCNENIIVPQGKTIIIVGATSTAQINAANILLPALIAKGDVTIKKMKLYNSTGAAESLVQTDRGGSLTVISSNLSGPNVGTVVGAWFGTVIVANSKVVGGTANALEVWGAATLGVEGNPLYPTGPTAAFETYVRSKGDAIGCGQGGSLRVQAKTNGSANGIVTLEQSLVGISGGLCDVSVWNKTTNRANLRIRNNGQGLRLTGARGSIVNTLVANNTNQGVNLSQSDMKVTTTSITGNDFGLRAEQSRVGLDAVTISNTSGDVESTILSSVNFYNHSGVSSVPKQLTWNNSFICSFDSHILIDKTALSTSIGTQYTGQGSGYCTYDMH